MNDLPGREWTHHQGAEAVTTHANSGEQSSFVRKPFCESHDRADVANTHADSCEDAVAGVNPGQPVMRGGDSCKNVPSPVHEARGGGDSAGADAVLPCAADERAEPEAYDDESEVELDRDLRPVFGLHEGILEDAPAVGGP